MSEHANRVAEAAASNGHVPLTDDEKHVASHALRAAEGGDSAEFRRVVQQGAALFAAQDASSGRSREIARRGETLVAGLMSATADELLDAQRVLRDEVIDAELPPEACPVVKAARDLAERYVRPTADALLEEVVATSDADRDALRAWLEELAGRGVTWETGRAQVPAIRAAARAVEIDRCLRAAAFAPSAAERDRALSRIEELRRSEVDRTAVRADPLVRRSAAELIEDLEAGRLVRRPWLIEGLFQERDLVFLFGPAGLGKSQLALAMAALLAFGSGYVLESQDSPSWGVATSRPLRVLVVLGEDDKADAIDRLSAFLRRRGLAVPVHLSLRFPAEEDKTAAGFAQLDTDAGRAWLFSAVQQDEPDVVLLDGLTVFAPGTNLSAQDEAARFVADTLRPLQQVHRCTVLVLAHSDKGTPDGDARGALSRLFGSMVWGASANVGIMLDWVPGEPELRRIIHAKGRSSSTGQPIHVERAEGDCSFELTDAPVTTPPRSNSGGSGSTVTKFAVIAALRELANDEMEATYERIGGKIGVTERTVREHIGAIVDESGGELAIAKRGKKHVVRIVPLEERVSAEG